MPEKSKDIIEKNKKQVRSFWTVITTLGVILVAMMVALFFYKQRIEVEVPRDVMVLNELTEGWKTLESEKYKFSLKYPKTWVVEDLTAQGASKNDNDIAYVIKNSTDDGRGDISILISDSRRVKKEDIENAIQVSMPFDKNHYIIFTGHMDNPEKTSFYNMIATLKFIK